MSWLYLYFPNLQLDRFSRQEIDLVPFAVIDKNTNQVVQLNKQAYQVGVRPQMGIASSIALSADLQIAEYDRDFDCERIETIANSLYLIASDIFLDLPKGIYIKLNTMSKLYPQMRKLWVKVENTIKPYNSTYHFATSHSPLSAKLLAESKSDDLFSNKRESITQISTLPIETLAIPRTTKQALQSIGIKQIGNLLSLPLKELAIRFDIELVHCIGHITGELKQSLVEFRPKAYFSQTLELLFDISSTGLLQPQIFKLLQTLESFLINNDLTTQELQLVFNTSENEDVLLPINSASCQTKAQKWFELIQLKLEQLQLVNPIRNITLNSYQLEQAKHFTTDMLSTKEGNMDKTELISILQTKLGKEAVLQIQYKTEHLPEKSTILSQEFNTNNTAPSTTSLTPLRPALLLSEPLPLTEPVEIVSSPERIQTNWWNDNLINRDYFLAKNNSHQWYWVFRQPDKNWYLHGYFC